MHGSRILCILNVQYEVIHAKSGESTEVPRDNFRFVADNFFRRLAATY